MTPSLITTVPKVLQVKCQYCSRFWPSSEVLTFGDSVVICFYCNDKMRAAWETLEIPQMCQGPCGRSFQAIAAATPGERVGFTLHWRDEIYEVLCAQCDADYVMKRQDLYGDTPFGYERGVK